MRRFVLAQYSDGPHLATCCAPELLSAGLCAEQAIALKTMNLNHRKERFMGRFTIIDYFSMLTEDRRLLKGCERFDLPSFGPS